MQVNREFQARPLVPDLPIYNNFGDYYTVVVSSSGYKQVRVYPVKMCPNAVQSVDLMLLPTDADFNFRDALWPTLQQKYPRLSTLLANL